jgi:hypothetical protein
VQVLWLLHVRGIWQGESLGSSNKVVSIRLIFWKFVVCKI